ncbi:MAG: hypothetical protein NVS1B10_08940 [Candidatus Saccharimonadales bacterium]
MSDVSWSYSSLSTALTCLRKFKCIYIDKLGGNQPTGDTEFGTAIHMAINALLTGKSLDDAQELFALYWETHREGDLRYGRFKWQALGELGFDFIRKFHKGHLSKYIFEFGEQRLFAEYLGTKLEGTLDFYGLYNGVASLRDFKTSSGNYDATKTDTALQLYLYAYLGIRSGLKPPVTLGYTVFNKAAGSIQDLTWDFNEKQMYSALDEMVKYTKIVEAQDSYPKNYAGCMSYNTPCQFYKECHGQEGKQ